MTERDQMIGLLREAYEELEWTNRDRCECDESVGLECYPCRLRNMLHKLDSEWSCAWDEEQLATFHTMRYYRN